MRLDHKLPKGWRMEKLGDVTTIVSGSTPDSKQPRYWNGNINWIAPAEIHDDSRIVSETARKITQEGFDNSSTQMFPAGTIVLTTRAPIGKVAIAGVEMCSNQGCKNLLPNNKVLDGLFLFWWLKNNTDYLNSRGSGATFKEISASTLRNIQLPLPPLSTQLKIVAILDAADVLRRKRRETDAKMKDLIPAIFVKMFGDPATNPMGWNKGTLGDFGCKVRYGLTQPPPPQDDGMPIIRATNISAGLILTEGMMYVDKSRVPKAKNAFLASEDVVVVRSGAYTGDVAKVGKQWEGSVAGYDLVISPGTNFTGDFITWYLLSSFIQKNYFASLKQRAAQPHLNAKQLLATPVPLPPFELQQHFSEVLAHRQFQVEQQTDTSIKLDTLFTSLMHKAFRGELVS